MKKKIENPKVFVSYAWGSDEYQNRVLTFVTQLRSDGIDTVFDKWDLIEGNDTYAFMEKRVTDSSKTYFNQRQYYNLSNADGFNMFYSGSVHRNLDNAVCERDNQKYYSGTAQYWTQNIRTEFCTKEQFVLADLICFNYSVYGKDYISDWPWFPVAYIYDNEYNSSLAVFAKKMISLEYLKDVLPLFGYDDMNDFIKKFKSVERISKNEYRDYRYHGSFKAAHLLSDFIKAEQIASLR